MNIILFIILLIIVVCIIIIIQQPLLIKEKQDIDKDEIIKKDLLEDFYVSMGASYDEKQDIIYSDVSSWQRPYGYCSVYDKLAWTLYMSVDCEPVYFNYNNRLWMIEFWKGQYVIATGCEVGIYVSDELNMPPEDIFFYSVDDEDMIKMEFVLKKNGEILFSRKEKHWWLNGFRFGEFSNPKDLSMDIRLTFKDRRMLKAFRNALKDIGYEDISIERNSISFEYNKPKAKQSFYRGSIINVIVQMQNKYFCRNYNKIVNGIDSISDKIKLMKEYNINMYIRIMKALLRREVFYKKQNY